MYLLISSSDLVSCHLLEDISPRDGCQGLVDWSAFGSLPGDFTARSVSDPLVRADDGLHERELDLDSGNFIEEPGDLLVVLHHRVHDVLWLGRIPNSEFRLCDSQFALQPEYVGLQQSGVENRM